MITDRACQQPKKLGSKREGDRNYRVGKLRGAQPPLCILRSFYSQMKKKFWSVRYLSLTDNERASVNCHSNHVEIGKEREREREGQL